MRSCPCSPHATLTEDLSRDTGSTEFAGVLEKLETDFYTQALAKFQDSDFTAAGFGDVEVPEEIFTVILADESAHSSIIDSTLVAQGAEPLSSTCSFDFGDALQDVTTMAATARVIENVGVSGKFCETVLSPPRLFVADHRIQQLTWEAPIFSTTRSCWWQRPPSSP